jgi:hypothetical protein
MIRIRCCNPAGCTAPNGIFELKDHRYRCAEPAYENEIGACSILVICSYCGYKNLIWLKNGPTDQIYDIVTDRRNGIDGRY